MPTREGYTFTGWFTAQEGGEAITPETVVTADMTIYARWEPFDGHDKVQLWEGGPYWATTNIGAEKPEDTGDYFWWGDTVGNQWEWGENVPTYGKDIATLQSEGWITADGVLTPEHDAAHVQWGGNWRMPTAEEFEGLINNCDWEGVIGYGYPDFIIVRGRGNYASASIVLPIPSVHQDWAYGEFWTSNPFICGIIAAVVDPDNPGFRYAYLGGASASDMFPIRPVQSPTK